MANSGNKGILKKPHVCKFCPKQATTAIIHADGRAFVAVCRSCYGKGRKAVSEYVKDVALPAKTSKAVIVFEGDVTRTATLLIEHNGLLEGWELDLARDGTLEIPVEKAIEAFNADGDRCSKSLRHGVAVTKHSTPTKINEEAAVVAAAMEVELGIQSEAIREFFVKGDKLTGSLVIETHEDKSSTLTMHTGGVMPAVLSCAFPAPGECALPESLAKVVREEHRYWEQEGKAGEQAHRDLCKSEFFTEDNIKLVSGDLCKVVQKTYLYVPPTEHTAEAPRPKFRKRLDTIIGKSADIAIIAAPVEGECWDDVLAECLEGVDPNVVAVIAESRPAVSPDELATVVAKLDRHFVIGLRDSADAQTALAKLSSPFTIDGDEDFVWAYSGAVAKANNVAFVDTVTKRAIPQFFEDYEDHSGENDEEQRGHELRVSAISRSADPDGGWFYGCGVQIDEESANAQHWKDSIRYEDKWFTPIGTTARTDLEIEQWGTIQVLASDVVYASEVPKQLGWTTAAEVIGQGGAVMTAVEVIEMITVAPESEEMSLTEKVLGGHKILKTIMPETGSVEERFVLGIVLEPEEIDAQKDIYSDEEVRTAAHKFMEQYQNIGLMHREVVNAQVKILESYVSPVDFEMDGILVKKGTWLLAVRVLDDALWVSVKEGGLTGFSIGGSAVRVPERPAPN